MTPDRPLRSRGRDNGVRFVVRLQFLITLVAAVSVCGGTPQAADPSSSTAGRAPESHVSVLTAEQVIQILDDTIDWYRTLGTQQQNATAPSDLLILFANRQTADKVVGLAFEIARANAELLSSEASSGQSAAHASAPQALRQQQAQLEPQRLSIQQEMNAAKQQLAAPGKRKRDIEAKLIELQGELAMVNARSNLLDTMTDFVSESNPKTAGANALKAQIEAIAATIPTSSTNTPATPSSSAGSTAAGTTATGMTATSPNLGEVGRADPTRYGIWDLGVNVLRQRKKVDTIDVIDRHTAALSKTFQKISTPPLKRLEDLSARSDTLAAQADNASGDALKDLRNEFDTLAWLFKQTSDILIPLSKVQVLLLQYRHNLASWRDAAERQYHEALAALGIRSGILAGILSIIFALGEVWRRAVLRYAHEPHRRYQLLLVRRLTLWAMVIGIVALSSVTKISTFATFAGLLTAGLAVALQSVLVSVVGYFFLIGKYGIRVGDRIQIGTVVGEVMDLGLVRMHLRELNQQGPLGPTGRVVAFANLIVFQASGGLFKQLPDVNFSSHETTLTLPVVSDYGALKDKLLAAISAVLNEYSEEFSRQTKEATRTIAADSVSAAAPQVQMHLSNGRMDAQIRYPVLLERSAEIDERVAKAVLKIVAENSAAQPTVP
jgi:small-conductance mechanosensitive channel